MVSNVTDDNSLTEEEVELMVNLISKPINKLLKKLEKLTSNYVSNTSKKVCEMEVDDMKDKMLFKQVKLVYVLPADTHNPIAEKLSSQLIRYMSSRDGLDNGLVLTQYIDMADIVIFPVYERMNDALSYMSSFTHKGKTFIGIVCTPALGNIDLSMIDNLTIVTQSVSHELNNEYIKHQLRNPKAFVTSIPIHNIIDTIRDNSFQVETVSYQPHLSKLGYYKLKATSLDKSYNSLKIVAKSPQDVISLAKDLQPMTTVFHQGDTVLTIPLTDEPVSTILMLQSYGMNKLLHVIRDSYMVTHLSDYDLPAIPDTTQPKTKVTLLLERWFE